MKDLIQEEEDEAHKRWLSKVWKVFSREVESRACNKTQGIILDGLMAQAVEHSGGTDNVTIDQLIGIKEMLENEFTLAAALSDDEPAE
ncbi:MAG: hypothetical protein WEB31_07320 [Chthoniobacterales bacterium]